MKVVIFDDVLCRRQPSYSMAGLELSFHEHADDAVEVVRRERPDVILMDFSMDSALSGAEAVARLRAASDLGPLRIVGISSDPQDNERMLAAGADDAVPKTHLRAYLHRLLDQQRLDRRLR
ncbi:MAG: response regulator [Myxococcales bacterium]|nr:response regulator [Myxococcota bacterium]MDW8284022.1 response regulator [Myxococcales bacterium]